MTERTVIKMPCWYKREITLGNWAGADHEALSEAMTAIGATLVNVTRTYGERYKDQDSSADVYEWRIDGGWIRRFPDGRISSSSDQVAKFLEEKLPEAYSRAVVKKAAARFGWITEETGEQMTVRQRV